jgi:hypothetical protein
VPAVEPLEDRVLLTGLRDTLIARESLLNSRVNGGAGFSYFTDSGSLAWGESYVLSTYLTMYHATANTKYLDQFVAQANRVIADASDINSDGYLGWGSSRFSVDGLYAEYAVHDGMITAPMAQFAAYVGQTPALKAAYGSVAANYVAFIQTNILPKWEPYYQMIDDASGTYVFPNDNSSYYPLNSLPHNQSLALGRTFLWLYAATGDPNDAARATQIGNSFKNWLSLDDGGRAYVWNYGDAMLDGDTYDLSHYEDTSHANIEVGFAVDASQLGLVFNSTDLQRFRATFTDVMWNHSLRSPRVCADVAGDGGTYYSQYVSGWAQLAGHDISNRIWLIISGIYESNHLWSTASRVVAMLTIARLLDALPSNNNLIINGSFETAGSTSLQLAQGWSRLNATRFTAYRENTQSVSGNWALAVATNPARGVQMVQQGLYYLPGTAPITVTFWGCTNGSPAGGCLDVYDYTTHTVLARLDFTNTVWQQFTLSFLAPAAAGHNVQVRLYQTDSTVAGGTAYFDDVVVSQS